MKIKEITSVLEQFAPLSLQESYDNAGLIVGHPDAQVHKALLAVDVTDEVMDEAEREGCDLIITHHPIVFHPLKRFNSSNYIERCVERAIRHNIALYACHTNLDSAPEGMSWHLAKILGIGELHTLQPTCPNDIRVGFGVVGNLATPLPIEQFLREIQQRLRVKVIRHSDLISPTVHRVAVCTGAGAFLIEEAAHAEADLYITSDLKYNDFMTPDRRMTVADIGHFESEYCAIDILFDILSKNLSIFAVRKSGDSRNPINYWV
ncbi:MAG: Nif3-like dinuclear metal center hexameric protein [Alistipes sp.]